METNTLRTEILPAIERWQALGQQVAVATVVRVVGTAPRREGAKMVVSSGGELAGSVSGGCVEGAVVEEALRVLKTGKPVLLQYGITADMLTDVGLSCGGAIEVFVEPYEVRVLRTEGKVNASSTPHSVLSTLYSALGTRMAVALATVISGGLLGAKMLVQANTERVGSIHPDIDRQVEDDTRSLLAAEKNQVMNYKVGTEKVEVFVECFPPPQRLVIIGAVHIAIPLHRLAHVLGYHVTVVDARGLLATAERFPLADSLLVEWPDDALEQLGVDSATSVVVLTHDPKFDIPALKTALQSPACYIGAIGSRTTNESRFATLRAEGMTDEQIARVYAPVGLDIGARTPAEIALAVLAEVVAVRAHRTGEHLRGGS